jgi:predicted MFS family arabinose efflux permease
LAINAVGTAIFVVGTELWHFTLARIVLGVGSGMFLPAVRRVIVLRDPARAGELLGQLGAVEVGGFVAGPPLAAFLAEGLGLKAPFVIQLVALVLCAPAMTHVAEPPAADEIPKGATRVLLRNPGVRAGLALGAGVYLAIGIFDAIWARFLKDMGASTAFVGITLTLFALPLVFLTPAGGRLADRMGAAWIGTRTLSATVILVALYGVTESLAFVCIVAAGHALLEAVTSPAAQSAVARASGSELLAAGQGLHGATGNAFAAISALAAAPVYGRWGAGPLWVGAAAGVAICALLSHIWHRADTRSHARGATDSGVRHLTTNNVVQ